MSSVSQLKPFLEPKSLAVVGANPNSGEKAFNVVENLASCGYRGKVYHVNPNYTEILGQKCYPSVKEIPGDVDLAIIVTPRKVVPPIVRQCGIIRADDIDDLADLVRAFSYLPPMKGRRLGVVTASGGIGIMTLDACARHRLEVAELTPETKKRLNDMSPTWYRAGNPLDIWPLVINSTHPFGETIKIAMTEMLGDPRVNAIVVFAGAWFQGFKPLITDVMKETADAFPDKPIAWCPYDGWLFDIHSRDLQDVLEDAGRAAVFSIPDDAVRALSRLADYSEFRKRSGEERTRK